MTEVDEVARRTRRRRKRRDNPTGEMPLREHLTELRNRLLKSGLAVAVGMVAVSYTHLTLPTKRIV